MVVQIYLCIVCCITHIPWGILGICFCNWVYCIFWRFCVWLYFWRCLLIALVYNIYCLTWSCRASNNHFDKYFDVVVFCCLWLFSCQKYLACLSFVWRLLWGVLEKPVQNLCLFLVYHIIYLLLFYVWKSRIICKC